MRSSVRIPAVSSLKLTVGKIESSNRMARRQQSEVEALAHGDVGHVGAPDVIGSLDRRFAPQVWIDAVLRVWIARARPLVDRRQPPLSHQSPGTAAAACMTCMP